MIANFYNNKSDPRVVNKSISLIYSADCQIIEPCSLINPTIKVGKRDDLNDANYFYLAKWGRYYYVTDRTYDGAFIYLSGHSDWRMSFKNNLLNAQIIAERSSSNADPYVPDPAVTVRDSITTINRKVSTSPFIKPSAHGRCYVLTIGGK